MMHKSGTKNEIKESSIPFDFNTHVFVYMHVHMPKCMECGFTKIKTSLPNKSHRILHINSFKKISLSLIHLYISI